MYREIENVQLVLVQFVNHEADDLLAMLRDHADAIALPQAAQEIFLGPGEFKALLFGLKYLGHVAANHPANMDACLFFFRATRAHTDTSPPRRRASPPWVYPVPRVCHVLFRSDGYQDGSNGAPGLKHHRHRRILAMGLKPLNTKPTVAAPCVLAPCELIGEAMPDSVGFPCASREDCVLRGGFRSPVCNHHGCFNP